MFDWEHGDRFKHFDSPARARLALTFMQEDEEYRQSIQEIAKYNAKAGNLEK